MAKKLTRTSASNSGEHLAKQVMDSAQKIWLAGLGAFAKAQEEGGKVFDSLVKQGQAIEKKTRSVAGQAVETAKARASENLGKAAGKWDKFEQVFEGRVHRSLNRLGVLTSKDVEHLTKQVADLSESVRSLIAQEKRGAARKAKPKGTVAKVTAAAKKTAKSGLKRAAKAVRSAKAKLS
jgi:poly(hydroxyalkanoate) granule-associated protein